MPKQVRGDVCMCVYLSMLGHTCLVTSDNLYAYTVCMYLSMYACMHVCI